MFKWVKMAPKDKEAHRNSTPNTPFSCRLDLSTAARHYINFLKKSRRLRIHLFKHPGTLRAAVVRYESLWLPLVERYQTVSKDTMLPPIDIHVVWILHMLTGEGYVKYCKNRFGRIIDHAFFFDQNEARKYTEQLWGQRYSDEPFQFDASSTSTYEAPYEADLQQVLSIERQASDQWMLPHFSDETFIESASRRYLKFIELLNLHAGEALVPTFDIQLIWWTHMLHPDIYHREITHYCNTYISFISVHKEAIGADHGEVWDNSEALFQLYHDDFQLPGTRLYPTPLDVITGNIASEYEPNITEEIMKITLNKLHISNILTNEKDLVIDAKRLGASSASYDHMFRIKGRANTDINIDPSHGVGTVYIDLKRHRGIELHIYGKRGACCRSKESHIATLLFDPRHLFENFSPNGIDAQVEIPRVYSMDPTVTFHCQARLHEKRAPFVFTLTRDQFSPLPLPADFRAFVEHLEWWMHEDFLSTNSFMSALHTVHMRSQPLNMSCQVVCSTESHLSMVSVSHQTQGRLTLAYTVGEDMLPDHMQVGQSFLLSVDSLYGDTAMVIRNQQGLWGVCVAGKHPTKGSDAISVAFYNISSQAYYACQVVFPDKPSFTIGEVTVDLQTGLITLTPGCSELAEYLTLAFCVGNQYAKMCAGVDTNSNFQNITQQLGTASLSRYFKGKTGIPRSAPGSLRGSVSSRSATLKRLTSRPGKRQSILCTMLLACGLRASKYFASDHRQERQALTSQISLVSTSSAGSGMYLHVPKMRFQPQTGFGSYANLNRESLSIPDAVMPGASKGRIPTVCENSSAPGDSEVKRSTSGSTDTPSIQQSSPLQAPTDVSTVLKSSGKHKETAEVSSDQQQHQEDTRSETHSVCSRRSSVKSNGGWGRMDSFINAAFADLDEYDEYEIDIGEGPTAEPHNNGVFGPSTSTRKKESVSSDTASTVAASSTNQAERTHLKSEQTALDMKSSTEVPKGIPSDHQKPSTTETNSKQTVHNDVNKSSGRYVAADINTSNKTSILGNKQSIANSITNDISTMQELGRSSRNTFTAKHIKSKSETFIVTQALVHHEPEMTKDKYRKTSMDDSTIFISRL